MSITTVVNVKNATNYDVYIGRNKHSTFHYGNPYSHNPKWCIPCKDRAEAVSNYRLWLKGLISPIPEPERRAWILNNLEQLRGKTLGCFCSPLVCHGDILMELLRSEGLQQKHS